MHRAVGAAGDLHSLDTIIYGTPEEVTDKLQQLREQIGLDYLIASPLSHESFMLFTERVLPRLL